MTGLEILIADVALDLVQDLTEQLEDDQDQYLPTGGPQPPRISRATALDPRTVPDMPIASTGIGSGSPSTVGLEHPVYWHSRREV